jgi:hypothetical protein
MIKIVIFFSLAVYKVMLFIYQDILFPISKPSRSHSYLANSSQRGSLISGYGKLSSFGKGTHDYMFSLKSSCPLFSDNELLFNFV